MEPLGTRQRVWRSLRSTLGLRFASLPSRIMFSVFAAALLTGVAVAWVSTQSTEAFLRQDMDDATAMTDTIELLGLVSGLAEISGGPR